MPTMNVVLDIASPPAGLVPYRWTYVENRDVDDTGQMYLDVARMRADIADSEGIRQIREARGAFNQEIIPANMLDLFRLADMPVPVPGAGGNTFYPIFGFVCTRFDLTNRDVALLFPNSFPFTMSMTFQRRIGDTLAVDWNVIRYAHRQSGSIDLYDVTGTPGNIVYTLDGANPAFNQNPSYFDGDEVIFNVTLPEDPQIKFKTYGEIITAETGFEVTIAGEGDTVPSQTVNVRVRYNPNIEAGYLATLDGDTYTITGVEITERYRYMRLSLTRYVTS